MYIPRFIIATILVLISFNNHVVASDGISYVSKRITVEYEDGLIVQLPTTTPDEILSQVQALRTKLLARQLELDEILEEGEFDSIDAFIALIVPGGMVYAAIREMKHKQVASQLESVASELSQLSKDMEMLNLTTGENTVSIVQHFYPAAFDPGERSYTMREQRVENSCEPWCISKLVAAASPGVQMLETDYTGLF